MKTQSKTTESSSPATLERMLLIVAGVMVALLPFHAFLTVWLSTVFGNYTSLRLWKEFILTGLAIACLFVFLRQRIRLSGRSPLVFSTILYIALVVVCGLIAYRVGGVSGKAYAYGLLLDSRFLIFFLIVWRLSRQSDWLVKHWRRLLLIPASVVVVFGLLQFTLLPADFLGHFGYGPLTIDAVQMVDQKAEYQRVQSTLRGANPLGVYLVLILAATAALVMRRSDKRAQYAALFATACAVLALTFSRSAWLGAFIALAFLLRQTIRSQRSRRLLVLAAAAAILVFGVTAYVLRDNDIVQNTLFHTDENSLSVSSSNEGHVSATRQGISDVIASPFGGGTGTAGPASVYNDGKVRIAENYFVQIGQEVGVVGLGLFVAINILVARALWLRRSNMLPRVLLASLLGISLVNILSHAWTDDTLSYIWWGLAGAALALPTELPETKK